MSVIAEVTLPTDAFPLGRALESAGEVTVELERIVPLSDVHIPYIWVESEDVEAFERTVAKDQHVDGVTRLDRVDDRTLYRIDWAETETGVIHGIREADAAIMDATGGDVWQFRLHFPDHDRLRWFSNYCTEHDIPIHLDRLSTLAEASGPRRAFDLTPDQREALALALRRGYFATPRQVSLADLASELGVSKQAISQRIRKATERVLTAAMLATADTGGDDPRSTDK